MSYNKKPVKIAPIVSKKAKAEVRNGLITFNVDGKAYTGPAEDWGAFQDGDTLIILYHIEKNGEVVIKAVELESRKDYELIGDVVFPADIKDAFVAAQELLNEFGFVFVSMVGPSGCGKTTYPRAWAAYQNMKFYETHMALKGERQDILGEAFAENGTTGFRWSNFINAYAEGDHVIVMDEINRADPESLNPIMSMTDFRRSIEYGNQAIQCGPNNMLVATSNVGWQFTGTLRLDAAIENRPDIVIKVDFLPADVEAQYMMDFFGLSTTDAESIARVMTTLRSSEILKEVAIDLSTRRAFSLAKICKVTDLQRAFKHGLISRVPDDALMETINAIRQVV